MQKKRLIIYVTDVCAITGKSERSSRALLRKIRKANDKPHRHQFVSFGEFCRYTNLSEEEVNAFLFEKNKKE